MCISIGLGDGVYFCPVHTLPDGMATPDSLSVLGICKPDCPRLIPMPIAITEDMSSTPDINKTPQFGTLPPNTPFPITTATTTMNTITTTSIRTTSIPCTNILGRLRCIILSPICGINAAVRRNCRQRCGVCVP
ncbi:uncharacterized protein [Lepeophtheirus salmonis]|uniref:uncharacterized protein n=1 Tax=Lepeophtheirus salmonis TaxID=72036 RepID=UPI003AF352E4